MWRRTWSLKGLYAEIVLLLLLSVFISFYATILHQKHIGNKVKVVFFGECRKWEKPAAACNRTWKVNFYTTTSSTPNTAIKPHINCFKIIRNSGRVRVTTSVQMRICGRNWKLLFTHGSHGTWQGSLTRNNEGGKTRPNVWKPARLTHSLQAVIVAKDVLNGLKESMVKSC